MFSSIINNGRSSASRRYRNAFYWDKILFCSACSYICFNIFAVVESASYEWSVFVFSSNLIAACRCESKESIYWRLERISSLAPSESFLTSTNIFYPAFIIAVILSFCFCFSFDFWILGALGDSSVVFSDYCASTLLQKLLLGTKYVNKICQYTITKENHGNGFLYLLLDKISVFRVIIVLLRRNITPSHRNRYFCP